MKGCAPPFSILAVCYLLSLSSGEYYLLFDNMRAYNKFLETLIVVQWLSAYKLPFKVLQSILHYTFMLPNSWLHQYRLPMAVLHSVHWLRKNSKRRGAGGALNFFGL